MHNLTITPPDNLYDYILWLLNTHPDQEDIVEETLLHVARCMGYANYLDILAELEMKTTGARIPSYSVDTTLPLVLQDRALDDYEQYILEQLNYSTFAEEYNNQK
jgi:hypothetical protein